MAVEFGWARAGDRRVFYAMTDWRLEAVLYWGGEAEGWELILARNAQQRIAFDELAQTPEDLVALHDPNPPQEDDLRGWVPGILAADLVMRWIKRGRPRGPWEHSDFRLVDGARA